MAPTAQQLPTAVLAQILQCVPLQQRLLGCALVCKAWAAAAVAATSSISLKKSYVPNSFAAWMKKHGSKVGSLELEIKHRLVKPNNLETTYYSDWSEDNESQQEDPSYDGEEDYGSQQEGSPYYSVSDAEEVSGDPAALPMAAEPVDDERHAASTKLLLLPCAELQQLTRLSLQSTAGMGALQLDLLTRQQGSAASAAVLPKLVEMKLVTCQLASTDTMQKLFSTAALQLTKLHIRHLQWPGLVEVVYSGGLPSQHMIRQHAIRSSYTALQELSSVVQRCSNLVTLHLLQQPLQLESEDAQSSAISFPCISNLQKLQELVLFWPHGALPPVPPTLTHLALVCSQESVYGPKPPVLPRLPPLQNLRFLKLELRQMADADLASMTQVQSLHLSRYAINPATLASMTQLQELVLYTCFNPPAVMARTEMRMHAAAQSGTAAAAAPCAILLAIGQLRKLQVLEIVELSDSEQGQPALTAFSALTASSQLQRLRMDSYNGSTMAVPRGAFKYMFPRGWQLNQLVFLDLADSNCDFLPSSWRLTGKDLHRIAASCPGLQSLSIQGLLKPGADTSPLLLLTECRSLSVGGRAFDNYAAGVVAQMAQLTSLSWWCAQGLDSLGVQKLTALKNLRELKLVPIMKKYSEDVLHVAAYNEDPCSSLQPTTEMDPYLMTMLGLSSTSDMPVVLSSQGGMVRTPDLLAHLVALTGCCALRAAIALQFGRWLRSGCTPNMCTAHRCRRSLHVAGCCMWLMLHVVVARHVDLDRHYRLRLPPGPGCARASDTLCQTNADYTAHPSRRWAYLLAADCGALTMLQGEVAPTCNGCGYLPNKHVLAAAAVVQGTPVWRQLDVLCDRSSQVAPSRLRKLRADNQSLLAGNQQLILNNQSLLAGNQQLRADANHFWVRVQQLNVGNEHLLLSTQRLSADKQQLQHFIKLQQKHASQLQQRIQQLESAQQGG